MGEWGRERRGGRGRERERDRFRRRAKQSKGKRKGDGQRGEIKLVGHTIELSDREKLREIESARDQRTARESYVDSKRKRN